MIEAIARLRKIAEETESKAQAPGRDRSTRSDMIDQAVKWQWLAGEAAKLCFKSNKLNGFADCAQCLERCVLADQAARA